MVNDIKFRLSQSEMGVYLECLEETTKYNLPFYIKIDGFELPKLKEAIKTFIYNHNYVFTQIFIDDEGNIMKHIVLDDNFEIEEKQLDNIEELKILPFEILNSRLFRIEIYHTNSGTYLFFDFHHIILDGGSIKLFIDEVFGTYFGFTYPKESYNANDYADDEIKERNSDKYLSAKKYYYDNYSGLEVSSIFPIDKLSEKVEYDLVKRTLNIDAKKVSNFVKSNNIKTSSFFISVFSLLLSKMNMDKESLITTVHNGRNNKCKNSVGMYVHTFPFYVSHKDVETVKEYLIQNNSKLISNVENDIYSYIDISKDLGVGSEIMFAYQGDYMYKTTYNGQVIYAQPLDNRDGKGNMSIELHRDNGEYIIWFEYRYDIYEKDTVNHIIDLFEILANEMMNKEKLCDISLLDDKQQAILDKFNENDLSKYDFTHTIIDYFYKNCDKNPSHDFVIFKDKKYTYEDGDKISSRIANKLISLGIKNGDVVSVLIPKSEYIVLVSLGILKSGAAYQPLDPSYPKERLNFMVNDARAKLLILDRNLDGIIDYDCPKIYLDELDSFKDETRPNVHINPNDLFIMLYTSGTTGLPKGVMLSHLNILTISLHCNFKFEENCDSKMASYPSYGFDAHMMDIYSAITCGGSIYVIPDDMRLDLLRLGEYYNECGITHSIITTQVGRQFAENVELTSLKYLFVGGEKLVPLNPPKGYKLYNLYGPTEGSIFCTEQLVDKLYHRVPIGNNLETYRFYILDEYGNRVPYGVKGELYISGEQVGMGYLNREEENKKAFLHNRFENIPHFEKLYKTGDIVRILKNGAVDFIGRNDGQVKIRGFRVELSEIEQIIRQFHDIKDVTIKDFVDPSGICYLCVYVVSDKTVNVEELNAFIGANKPSYMIPAYTMQIDAIPLNQNQKVNKRALPQPELKKSEVVKPENEDEQKIFDILANILGHNDFGVTTDIYECGLTSITSIKFVILLTKAFDKNFKNSDLKENNTIRKLAEFANVKEEKVEYEILSKYPLTKTQEGILVECLTDTETTKYNIPYLLELSEKIDIDRLQKAIVKALSAHKYCLSHLESNDDGDVVAIRENYTPKVLVIEQENLDISTLIRPFNLIGGDLYRVEIYKTSSKNYLFLDFHHIICDGTSFVILFNDITKAYLGEDIEEEIYTGYEIALEENKNRNSELYSKAKEYYETLLSNVETEYDFKRDLKVGDGKFESCDIQSKVDKSVIDKFIEENKLTQNALFSFVFSIALSKFVYKDEALYTTIYNGRNNAKVMNVVSMLVKTLPVYLKYSQDDKIIDLIKSLKEQIESSENNDIYSFAEISSRFGVKSDIFFAYQGDMFNLDSFCGEHCPAVILESDSTKSKFSLEIFGDGKSYNMKFEYDNGQFNKFTIESFARLYDYILGQVTKVENIKDLSYVSDYDKELYKQFNNTDVYIPNITVCDLIEKQAYLNPNKVAVVAYDGEYTYKELNEQTNRIAYYLLENDISFDSKVVVLMPRSKNAYPCREGVLKSGGAFIPVDPKYPDERIEYIITDSGAKAVISTKEIIENKKELLSKLNIDIIDVEEALKNPNKDNPNLGIKQSNLCYIIYTSGTTGKPKGVMISHRNLLNLCLDETNLATYEYRLQDNTVGCSFASLSFDASMQEEFIPLTHGYTACIASEEEIENPILLAKKIRDNNVNVMFMTPSFVANVLDSDEMVNAFKLLNVIDMGAEAVPYELVEKIRANGINAHLFDGYGPTETTVTCTYGEITDKYITIGKPVGNTRLYILDKHDNILPIGALGNLTIAGEGVGIGYLGLEQKTKESFITLLGKRAYKSGDIARYNYDGNVEFFGRIDNQVKLRGLRIELDEIEKAILSYQGITSAIVVVKNNASEGDYLCAYYCSSYDISSNDIIEHISKTLTPYMVPKIFVKLDKLPLTPNGKVDKRALPEPNIQSNNKEIKKPRNELEEKITKIFAKALGLQEVGIDEDFFTLGGTSLSVSKVAMLAIKEKLSIAYKDVFDYSTPMELAKHISGSEVEDTPEEKQEIKLDFTDEILKYNDSQFVSDIKKSRPLGRVLLCGATGFLGLHVLKELLNQKMSVIALVRGGSLTCEERLKALLTYYFDSPMDEEIEKYVTIIDGDVTSPNLSELLENEKYDTIINCAAIVKHFAQEDIIERVNVGGVKNLIEISKDKDVRLIQISTLSVAGENIDNKFPDTFKLKENMLYVGQDLSNKYVNSKFMAEKAVLEACEKGFDGKVIRVGNLMGRQSDGEFQINYVTNNFIKDLRSYIVLGKFPVSWCDTKVDFSPIDEVTKTIILLAQTDKKFTLFHSANSHEVEMGDIIEIMNNYKFKIDITSDEEFENRLNEVMQDDEKNMLVSSLISYASNDRHIHKYIATNNEFTIKALYRLGFKWPITDKDYLYRILEALDSLDFFTGGDR